MEKIVKTGRTAVFTLDGTECRLTFAQKYRGFDIENRSDGDILVSFRSGSVEGDDGTMTIPAGRSFNFMQMYESDTVYLTGTGKVAIAAKNDSNPNFKSSQGGGDSGTVIDTDINAENTNAHAAGSKAVYDFVTEAIADVSTFHAEIVEELPSTGASNILYLVAKASSESGNVYDEYLYIGGAWELIGSTDIDLSGYAKSSEMHALAAEIKGEIPTKVSELENDAKYITSDTELRFSVVDGILNVTYDDGGNA